jgi:hypothetical protein
MNESASVSLLTQGSTSAGNASITRFANFGSVVSPPVPPSATRRIDMPEVFTRFWYWLPPIWTTLARRYIAAMVGAKRSIALSISGSTR